MVYRSLIFALLLFLFFIMPTCPFCTDENDPTKGHFASSIGLTNHKRGCPGWKPDTSSLENPPEIPTELVVNALKRRRLERKKNDIESTSQGPPTGQINTDSMMAPVVVDSAIDIEMADFPLPLDSQENYQEMQPLPSESRSGHQRKVPKRFADMVPTQPTPFPHLPQPSQSTTPEAGLDTAPQIERQPPVIHNTTPNAFGLFRQYTTFPRNDPEDLRTLDASCFGSAMEKAKDFYAPFMNATTYRLMKWFYGSTTKSLGDLDKLVNDVLLAPDFDSKELRGFSAEQEGKRIDEETGMAGMNSKVFSVRNGWKVSLVELKVPIEGVECPNGEDDASRFTVHGVQHRSLTGVIEGAFRDPAAAAFHYAPHKVFWQKEPDGPPERVFTELYNSDAFLEEHAKIKQQAQISGPDANLETAVAAIMLWSDATHLANFGTASLWPIYCYFGNQSKYERLKPTNFAAHHLAYIPERPLQRQLPKRFQDWYRKESKHKGKEHSASRELFTHMKRELMHAIWTLLLDPEFRYAYVHGIAVDCADGICHLLFPWFFTYSADYPEKALLATICFLGGCPCPRCKIRKDQIANMGTEADLAIRANIRIDDAARRSLVVKAHREIFRYGKGVASAAVERILRPLSMVPTHNAFSADFLVNTGFDYHQMLVPDLLHEFELGTWKAVFTHLIRILYASGDGAIQELNKRYQSTPTFGQNTIHRFSEDASSMKKLAGRDFEDLLQCSIPAFELLLPEPHNSMVLDLLFTLGTWHALAKLRLHTETTLRLLKATTSQLGYCLRKFQATTCSYYHVEDLPSNETARGPINAKTATSQAKGKGKAPKGGTSKPLNLSTYKLHGLGDYVDYIIKFGPSDGFSTQTVSPVENSAFSDQASTQILRCGIQGELEHRRVKKFYIRTNKMSTFAWQIARHERRERLIHQIHQMEIKESQSNQGGDVHIPFEASEPLAPTPPTSHFHISQSRSFPRDVTDWLHKNRGDPALEDFLPKLKDHLLERLEDLAPGSRKYSDAERNQLTFSGQDSINPRTHPDIMVFGAEPEANISGTGDDHPYLYARVIGVFHAEVQWMKSPGQRAHMTALDFLWVRWFVRDTSHPCAFRDRRPPCLQFASEGAFGFLDPKNVLRGCHLIPAFAHGQVSWLGQSVCRPQSEGHLDWRYYYSNTIVDRDIFMRYLGGGVGHGLLGIPTDTSLETLPTADDAGNQDNSEGVSPTANSAGAGPGVSTTTIENSQGDDDSAAPPENSYSLDECIEYGYPDPNTEPMQEKPEELEVGTGDDGSDMDEDGEGGWDFDQPENDAYGAFN
ncbi:hypothetical protein NP233_g9492 [Leucocoprinus birnbaumii]|uniref:Uncharacterized protein n=1 Tax=Leucocoprinus birnbaumii TaxID=56174 RepID=A0AAD5YQT3_9AGAR|nr:hypothetical protein NP233_g9492 [Leucocoprinus birnbaumii]